MGHLARLAGWLAASQGSPFVMCERAQCATAVSVHQRACPHESVTRGSGGRGHQG